MNTSKQICRASTPREMWQSYQDVLFAKRRRVEHWDNAVSQGRHSGRTLMGERAPFRHVPYFFSDVFDLSYEYWGDSSGAGRRFTAAIFRPTVSSVWWLREGRVVAAFTMNRPGRGAREQRRNGSRPARRCRGPG